MNEQSTKLQQQFVLQSLKSLLNIERKVVKNKKVIIDITNSRYELLKDVSVNVFNWQVISNQSEKQDDWNVMWNDTYILEDDLRKMMPYQKINHFPGSQQLGRKNLLAKNLQRLKKIFPFAFNFYPKTWLLPNQFEELRQFTQLNKDSQPIFIVKPEASCQGKGIFLTKRPEERINCDSHCVVQEYIKNPYLIGGLKFDFRVYVLLKSVNPLKVYIYREGLTRFSTKSYEAPHRTNLNNLFMHLTNYAINKKNPDFMYNKSEKDDSQGHKRSLTAVFQYLQNEGKNIEELFENISQIIIKTFCSVQPFLEHLYKSCQSKAENNEMCFEIFGFDIILDKELKPWLLEVNHTPSFVTDTPLDYQIKKSLIMDTLILANIRNKDKLRYFESKKNCKKFEDFLNQEQKRQFEHQNSNGFVQIYPSQGQDIFQQYMDCAKQIMDEFAGIIKNRQKTTSSEKYNPNKKTKENEKSNRPTSGQMNNGNHSQKLSLSFKINKSPIKKYNQHLLTEQKKTSPNKEQQFHFPFQKNNDINKLAYTQFSQYKNYSYLIHLNNKQLINLSAIDKLISPNNNNMNNFSMHLATPIQIDQKIPRKIQNSLGFSIKFNQLNNNKIEEVQKEKELKLLNNNIIKQNEKIELIKSDTSLDSIKKKSEMESNETKMISIKKLQHINISPSTLRQKSKESQKNSGAIPLIGPNRSNSQKKGLDLNNLCDLNSEHFFQIRQFFAKSPLRNTRSKKVDMKFREQQE